MYESTTREQALELLRRGMSHRAVAERLNVPRGTIGWCRHEDRRRRNEPFERVHDCPRCAPRPFDRKAYAYLLGLYLGDGHIVSKPRQHHLSVYCGDAWPGLIGEAEEAMSKVMATPTVSRRQKAGCVEVKSYTRHWTCMFPQHGPGRKHERRIALEPWQQHVVDEHPWQLIRGLFHSDGCRVTNWTTRLVSGQPKRYEYTRYFFTNKSDDILRICSGALTAVGVEWKITRKFGAPFNISVARRVSVVLMDARVGAKY
ncbi:helix-turn-helix domain-containing protein [Streptomyces sp. NPDC017056]|uniref:helix-turn-helix domain-containing protein n=1 Tax=Streptomyces sp. NPDC017056 TaxID=3364973 RepID=UPI0037AEB8B7